MQKVIEYKTVSGNTFPTLDKNVNEFLKDGWSLYGNPYSLAFKELPLFVQAIIKTENTGENSKDATWS
jgi:hypothetical protein